MTSFWLHKRPRTPNYEPSKVGICVRLLPHDHGQHINVLKHFVYVLCGCRKQFELAVSLNYDVMTSFWLHKWPWIPKYEQISVGITSAATAICPWTAYQCAQTLCICLMWMQEAVWVGCQPQPWHNHIILTPQVTQNPKIQAKYCGYNCLRLLPYAHRQHIKMLNCFVYV